MPTLLLYTAVTRRFRIRRMTGWTSLFHCMLRLRNQMNYLLILIRNYMGFRLRDFNSSLYMSRMGARIEYFAGGIEECRSAAGRL